jgi:hypothetical protein
MAAAIVTPVAGEHVRVPAWAWLLMVGAVFLTYVVLQENGWLIERWMTVHELFHDGRHALGFPCH